MKDYTEDSLPDARLDVPPLQAISYCIDRLLADRKHSLYSEVVRGLPFDALLGALKMAHDLAVADLERQERAERGE